MPRPFQEWAVGEIARLRAEADALEHALQRYLETEGAESATLGHAVARNGHASPTRRRRQPRIGPTKGERILEFVKAAGEVGVSSSELVEFTTREMGMNTNSTRSQMWHLEQIGLVERRDGRSYYVNKAGEIEANPDLPLQH